MTVPERSRLRGVVLTNIPLALQVDQLRQHLVGSCDAARRRLETALRDNHVGELLRQVDVGHFNVAGTQQALNLGRGFACARRARGNGLGK